MVHPVRRYMAYKTTSISTLSERQSRKDRDPPVPSNVVLIPAHIRKMKKLIVFPSPPDPVLDTALSISSLVAPSKLDRKADIETTETLVTLNLSRMRGPAVGVYTDISKIRCVRARPGSSCRRSALT